VCYSLWYNAPTMLPATDRQHCGCIIPQAVTHSLVLLNMGKEICPKHAELTEIINKPLLLHLVGCLYYLYIYIYIYIFRLAAQYQFIPLQNVVYFITLTVLIRKIFTLYINDVLLFKCSFPGPKVKSVKGK